MYDFVGLYDLKHTFRGKRQFPDRFGLQEELYKLVAEEGSWLVYQCQNKKSKTVLFQWKLFVLIINGNFKMH